MSKYTEDDYCDLYENKICDNCGKCLEEQGIDTKAIKIEDIAKTVEENKVLEEEYKKELESQEEAIKDDSQDENVTDAYKKFLEEHALDFNDDEYEDAFDYIDMEFSLDGEDLDLDTDTEEIYPGVRRFKNKKED